MSPHQKGENKVENAQHDGLEMVTDAYVRWTDVCFTWTKVLEGRHARAIMPLIDGHAMTSPGHPFYVAEDQGVTLFIGIDSIGQPRLLFSLKQLQYIQYYAHQYHLTDAAWCEYYARQVELLEEDDGLAKAAALEKPSGKVEDDWVPLPDTIIRASDFAKIIPHVFKSGAAITRAFKLLEKERKQANRLWRDLKQPYVFDPLKLVALEDNNTEGPGLRRGPLKQRESRRDREENKDRPDGVGWGGFPLAPKEDATPEVLDATSILKQVVEHLADESMTPGDQSDFSSGSSTPMTEDSGAKYHDHCQQAFILAIQGGLANSLSAAAAEKGELDEEAPKSDLPPEAIGRSLFLSLSVTTWEKDSDVVLEVGWAAVWWGKKLDSEGQESGERFEEMRDRGHFIIQDHLLDKRNGKHKPDFRDDYLFGNSLPISVDKLSGAIKQKIKDLSMKAGQGPTYILTHYPKGRIMELKDIGLDLASIHTDLQPDGWDIPPYVCTAGCGSTFLINTATLFGAIEGTSLAEEARTNKSLQHVALVMFGQEGGRVPEKCGNAGNDAFYALEVFLAIMTGPPLPILREDYRRTVSQQDARLDEIKRSATANGGDNDNGERTVVQSVPLTGLMHQRPATSNGKENEEEEKGGFEDDDDYQEDVNIGGIYYLDEDGNKIPFGDGDDVGDDDDDDNPM